MDVLRRRLPPRTLARVGRRAHRAHRAATNYAQEVSTTALGDYLKTLRAQVQPTDVGLVAGPRRRVAGLRRDEVATLAGISPELYQRIEQGRIGDPPRHVVDALAGALHLGTDQTAQLHRLAGSGLAPDSPVAEVAEDLVTLVDQLAVPALVLTRHLDCLASNALARALSENFNPGRNLLRALFLDPAERELHVDWDEATSGAVGGLRQVAAVSAAEPRLAGLVDELWRHSDDFRALWARTDLRDRPPGTSHLRHPRVGEIRLQRQRFEIPDTEGQYLQLYHAVRGTESAHRLAELQMSVARSR